MSKFNYIFFLLAALTLSGCSSARVQPPILITPALVQETKPLPPMPVNMLKEEDSKKIKAKGNNLIVIDPGHGGEDFGTHSNTKPPYQEKYLNLSTANLLKSYLTQQGYNIVLTRSDDTFISLDKRAEFANEKKPALFVSVHYNSAPSKEAEGVEVFFYKSEQDKKRSRDSRQLAQSILDQVLENTKAKSRGVKHGNFAVIRQTNMPAVLIEGGFLTNDSEMQRLKDPAYIKKLAWGIAQGIHHYLSDDRTP